MLISSRWENPTTPSDTRMCIHTQTHTHSTSHQDFILLVSLVWFSQDKVSMASIFQFFTRISEISTQGPFNVPPF